MINNPPVPLDLSPRLSPPGFPAPLWPWPDPAPPAPPSDDPGLLAVSQHPFPPAPPEYDVPRPPVPPEQDPAAFPAAPPPVALPVAGVTLLAIPFQFPVPPDAPWAGIVS